MRFLTASLSSSFGKFTPWMAPDGHTASHSRQSLHLVKSMYDTLSVTVTAPCWQVRAHRPQPMQALAQAFLATGPLSLLTQETNSRMPRGPLFRSSMMCFGQAFAQAPQAVHFASSTTGRPVSGSIDRAPNRQASTQSPHPTQP